MTPIFIGKNEKSYLVFARTGTKDRCQTKILTHKEVAKIARSISTARRLKTYCSFFLVAAPRTHSPPHDNISKL
jgi:hypothetical protein